MPKRWVPTSNIISKGGALIHFKTITQAMHQGPSASKHKAH